MIVTSLERSSGMNRRISIRRHGNIDRQIQMICALHNCVCKVAHYIPFIIRRDRHFSEQQILAFDIKHDCVGARLLYQREKVNANSTSVNSIAPLSAANAETLRP